MAQDNIDEDECNLQSFADVSDKGSDRVKQLNDYYQRREAEIDRECQVRKIKLRGYPKDEADLLLMYHLSIAKNEQVLPPKETYARIFNRLVATVLWLCLFWTVMNWEISWCTGDGCGITTFAVMSIPTVMLIGLWLN